MPHNLKYYSFRFSPDLGGHWKRARTVLTKSNYSQFGTDTSSINLFVRSLAASSIASLSLRPDQSLLSAFHHMELRRLQCNLNFNLTCLFLIAQELVIQRAELAFATWAARLHPLFSSIWRIRSPPLRSPRPHSLGCSRRRGRCYCGLEKRRNQRSRPRRHFRHLGL